MDLPKLTIGKRYTLPSPTGSADAMLLATLARRDKGAGRPMVVVTANAADAQRLLEEVAFLRRTCGVRCFPTGKPFPTTPFRRTRT